jgi:hypothetical protein
VTEPIVEAVSRAALSCLVFGLCSINVVFWARGADIALYPRRSTDFAYLSLSDPVVSYPLPHYDDSMVGNVRLHECIEIFLAMLYLPMVTLVQRDLLWTIQGTLFVLSLPRAAHCNTNNMPNSDAKSLVAYTYILGVEA